MAAENNPKICRYRILRLDSAQILEAASSGEAVKLFDGSAKLKTSADIGCIAYYQAERVLSLRTGLPLKSDGDTYDFTQYFADVDFSNAPAADRKKIFINGFSIQSGEESAPEKFTRFESSGNMLRHSRIIFVSETIRGELLKAITLDFNPPEPLSVSKWQAYKGLSLSSGFLVAITDFIDHAVVVDDAVSTYKTKYITGKVDGRDLGPLNEVYGKITINHYDGAGLITPGCAEKLKSKLPGIYSSATSFQFRLPFCKGMLHTVDFKKFLKEEIRSCDDSKTAIEVDTIKDVFGKLHRLEDVEVILTKSQFKAFKWWKQAGKNWDDYRRAFAEYDHRLFITGANASDAERGNAEELNYQWLSTLELNKDQFERLLSGSIDTYKKLRWDYRARLLSMLRPAPGIMGENTGENPDDAPEDAQDADADKDGDGGSFMRVDGPSDVFTYGLQQNVNLIKEAHVKTFANSTLEIYENNALTGRLLVSGKMRYLTPNLIRLMLHVAKTSIGNCQCSAKPGSIKLRLSGEDTRNAKGSIYAPGFVSNESNTSNMYCALARNPHLSPNEHCIVTIKNPDPGNKDHLFNKYLSHLDGICMIDSDSFIAERLGGADYDGDVVKIVSDETFTGAVSALGDLSFIVIPNSSAKESMLTENKEYEAFNASLSVKIGQYSNIAFKIAEKAYNPYSIMPENEKDRHKELLRRMTIYVGLEIDSVKSGVRPSPDEDINKFNKEKSLFLSIKNSIKNRVKNRVKNRNVSNVKQFAVSNANGLAEDGAAEEFFKREYKTNHPLCGLGVLFYKGVGNIKKRLLTVPLSELIRDIDVPVSAEVSKSLFALLMADKSVQTDIRSRVIRRVSGSMEPVAEAPYSAVISGWIDTTLKLQGYQDEQEIGDMIQAVHFWLKDTPTVALHNMIRRQREHYKWAFLDTYEKRRDVLARIRDELGLRKDGFERMAEVLCDFSSRGYDLLSYFLRYAIAGNAEERTGTAVTVEGINAEIEENTILLQSLDESDFGLDEGALENQKQSCRSAIDALNAKLKRYAEVFGAEYDARVRTIEEYREVIRDAAIAPGKSDSEVCRDLALGIAAAAEDSAADIEDSVVAVEDSDVRSKKMLVRAAYDLTDSGYDSNHSFFWRVAGKHIMELGLFTKGPENKIPVVSSNGSYSYMYTLYDAPELD